MRRLLMLLLRVIRSKPSFFVKLQRNSFTCHILRDALANREQLNCDIVCGHPSFFAPSWYKSYIEQVFHGKLRIRCQSLDNRLLVN